MNLRRLVMGMLLLDALALGGIAYGTQWVERAPRIYSLRLVVSGVRP